MPASCWPAVRATRISHFRSRWQDHPARSRTSGTYTRLRSYARGSDWDRVDALNPSVSVNANAHCFETSIPDTTGRPGIPGVAVSRRRHRVAEARQRYFRRTPDMGGRLHRRERIVALYDADRYPLLVSGRPASSHRTCTSGDGQQWNKRPNPYWTRTPRKLG